MDFIENLLPFLLFLAIGILKSRKTSEQQSNRNTVSRVDPKNIRKFFDDTKDVIQKHLVETVQPSKEIDTLRIEDETPTNETIKNLEQPVKKIDNTLTVKREPDSITKNEIGKEKRLDLSRANLVNSIIMSEILGKPKSLRK